MSDFLTAQSQLALDGPRLRPLTITTRPSESSVENRRRQITNGADGSDDSDDMVIKWRSKHCATPVFKW